MYEESHEVLERLRKLHENFASTLPEKLQAIDILWQTVKQHGNGADELYRAVHSLAGSAGMFGQQQLGDAARQLEQILRQSLGNAEPLTAKTIDIIETELNEFKELIQ